MRTAYRTRSNPSQSNFSNTIRGPRLLEAFQRRPGPEHDSDRSVKDSERAGPSLLGLPVPYRGELDEDTSNRSSTSNVTRSSSVL